MSTLFVLWIGLAGASETSAVPDEVVRALSMRHPVPCEEVEALTETPKETLLAVVEQVSAPPWAPMRAAECLARNHAAEVEPQLVDWVTKPELKGLGRQTLALLDAMPLPVAEVVARKALTEGPEPEAARERILKLEQPTLRALAEEGR